MAFDLNKSGKKGPAGKVPTPTTPDPDTTRVQHAKKAPGTSRVVPIVVGLLVVAGVAWFALRSSGPDKGADTNTALATKSESAAPANVVASPDSAKSGDSASGTPAQASPSAAGTRQASDAASTGKPAGAVGASAATTSGASTAGTNPDPKLAGERGTVAGTSTPSSGSQANSSRAGNEKAVTTGTSAAGKPTNSPPVNASSSASANTSANQSSGAVGTRSDQVGGGTSGQSVIPASFALGSADLGNVNASVADGIIAALKQKGSASVTVLGYASSDGPLDLNIRLSQERAAAFKQYLTERGVPSTQITAVGKGIDDPIASNDTPDGRRRNRRVEVRY